MSQPRQDCPICKGLGWYESPNYGNFSPNLDVFPCPECNEVEGSGMGCFISILVLVAFVVMVWGMR